MPKRKEQVYCSKSCTGSINGAKARHVTGERVPIESRKRQINKDGYLMVYAVGHPYADGRKMIAEHVRVKELELGRRILPGECVHHKDGNKLNNSLDNLELMTFSDHSRMHSIELAKTRKRIGGRFA